MSARLAALTRLGYLLTGDHQLAEDLAQTALAKAAQRWHRVTDPSAYVRQVMVHESVSWFRKRRVREVSWDETIERVGGADCAEDVVRRELFMTALRRLTPRQRAVIALRYYEDLSEAETAEVLGIAVGTVKSRTHLALKRLRQLAPELVLFTHASSEAVQ